MSDDEDLAAEQKYAEQKGWSADALEPADFYMDGPYMVFTEAYHLKRGYCCGSGCRHCPYGRVQGAAGGGVEP